MRSNNRIYVCLFAGCLMVLLACTRYVEYGQNSSSGSGTSTGAGTGTGSGSGSSSGSGSGSSSGTGANNPANPGATPLPPGSGGGSGSSSGKDSISSLNIIASSTSPCSANGELFTFKSQSVGAPSGAKYEWYFGDGKTWIGSDSVVTHSYQYAGTYSVVLNVSNSTKQLATVTQVIKAYGQNVVPTAEFYASTTNPNSGGNIFFFNSQSTAPQGSISQFAWDFGDGTTGSQASVTHSFTQIPADQTFNVKLTVTGSAGGCQASVTHSVTVPAKYVIGGSFSYTSTSPCAPSKETFTFTSNNTGVPSGASYSWDFGDGSSAIGKSVSYSYSYGNSYNVKLTISYNGQQLYTEQQLVTALGQNVTPQASFINQYTNPTTYSYNSTSTIPHGSITKYAWDFGDGTSATQPSVVNHVFPKSATAKTYTVTLTVTGNSGCSDHTSDSVTIPPN
ncbi:MAG: PKD domain-containing protein [Bacteroidota bacterium]|nr:PKD domain-containing protein [Bacteroidota bacterium]